MSFLKVIWLNQMKRHSFIYFHFSANNQQFLYKDKIIENENFQISIRSRISSNHFRSIWNSSFTWVAVSCWDFESATLSRFLRWETCVLSVGSRRKSRILSASSTFRPVSFRQRTSAIDRSSSFCHLNQHEKTETIIKKWSKINIYLDSWLKIFR